MADPVDCILSTQNGTPHEQQFFVNPGEPPKPQGNSVTTQVVRQSSERVRRLQNETQSRKREWGKGRERDGKGRDRKDGREKERGRENEGPLGGTSLGLLYGVNAPLLQPFWTFLSMLTQHRLNEQIKTRQWTQCEHFPLRERGTTLTLHPPEPTCLETNNPGRTAYSDLGYFIKFLKCLWKENGALGTGEDMAALSWAPKEET